MDGMRSSTWLVVPLTLPLAAAGLAFVFRGRVGPWVGLVTALGVGAAVVALAGEVSGGGPVVHAPGGWGAPLGIVLYADGLSVVVLGMNALVGAGVSVHAAAYFEPGHTRDFFWPLWLMLWGALAVLALAGDVFTLYVAFELMGLSAVALVALEGGPEALVAAQRYLLVGLLGSLAYLLGVALLYGAHGVLDMAALAARVEPSPAVLAAVAFITGGMVLKTALVPLHGWLPPAHANAPAPASALLSALVVKASFFVLLRLSLRVFPSVRVPGVDLVLGGMGMAAILWGAWNALRQERLKGVVAYSTVGQLGYLFLAFPLARGAEGDSALSGVIYFALSHACAKAALFLAAGNVRKALGHDRVEDLRGAAALLPVTFFAFLLAGLSIAGLPPSGGFIAKWLLLQGVLAQGVWPLALVLVSGGLLAAGYLGRVLGRALEAPREGAPARARLPLGMELPVLALALAAVLLGFVSPGVLALLGVGGP
jgi:multicomponent Na+:H+ antiporter subunit D